SSARAGGTAAASSETSLPRLSPKPPGSRKSRCMSMITSAVVARSIASGPGHDIVADLAPAPGEPVVDKPGKGAFYATDLAEILAARSVATLLVCGVTTEVCVHTTVREANDRGYRCLVVSDACGSYIPAFHAAGLAMIVAQGSIFGWVSDSHRVVAAIAAGRTA
ncbi:cysteine hydrolase, partial [Methylobacterium sp. WL116]